MATTAELFAHAARLHQAGNLREAERYYRQVLAADPGHADSLHLLGVLVYQAGRPDLALDLIRQAQRANPTAFAYLANLGLVYEALGRPDDATACYEQTLLLAPDCPEAHVGLGNLLQGRGRIDEAAVHYRQAIRARPTYPEAHNNLGNGLLRQGRPAEAVSCYHEALRLRPQYIESYSNLGLALRDLGRMDEALASLEQALRLRPDHADAHWNRALVWLLRGEFARGWPEYEWRWPAQHIVLRPFPQPRWDGSPMPGRTILLYAEQGLGDTMQFIRYAPLVKQRGLTVVVECQPALEGLLKTAPGTDCLVPRGAALPAFDVHAPLLSLPGLFHTTLATIPATVPYLGADSALTEHWRRELAPLGGFKIGVAWQGNPGSRDPMRSISLTQFAPLAAVDGVRLISLQKGAGLDQLHALADQVPVLDLEPRRHASATPFQDDAAIMQNLDLVISSDTAVAHLAGALGVPVWLALSFVPNWRWLLDRADSPWYPTMRLFRQGRLGDWDAVFADMAAALRISVRASREGFHTQGEGAACP